MNLINFTVEFDLFATMSDGVDDISLVPLTGTVVFTPATVDNKPALASEHEPRPAGVVLQPLSGVLDTDGQLRESAGGAVGVRLLANDPLLELESLVYRVTFNVATEFGQPIEVDGGYFSAPTTDVTVNLTDVLTPTASHIAGILSEIGYVDHIADSGTVGRDLVRADTIAAVWAALGVTPSDSGLIGQLEFFNIGTVTTSYTVDLDDGTMQECTLTSTKTCVFTIPSMPAGTRLTLIVKQPTVGVVPTVNGGVGDQSTNRVRVGNATFPNVRWVNGSTPTVTQAFRVADVFTFISDGTTIFGSVTQGHIYAPPTGHATVLGPRRAKGPSNPSRDDGLEFWTPLDVARAYQIPEADGAGITVGCVQFEGPPSVPALQAYVNYLGINTTLDVEIIYLPGAESQATNSDVGEAMLDMCVLTALLPAATHKVYQGPNTYQGFIDATRQALEECDLVTCSWYYVETAPWNDSVIGYPINLMMEFEYMLREARSRGVSFFVASGDWGSDVWQPYSPAFDRVPWHAEPRRLGFPANLPGAVSVGCTALHLDEDGLRDSEEATLYAPVFSTGGYSALFSDTMCPVVSAFGEFQQGFAVVLPDGNWTFLSSTSGSCPFVAAVHARMIQLRGSRFDFMDFALANTDAFHDITTGTNGAFDCRVGRDLVTGIGTPNGPALLDALSDWS